MEERVIIGSPDPGVSTPSGSRVRPVGRWASVFEYDPDAGCRAEDFTTKSDEYVKRFYLRETIKTEKGTVTPEVDVILQGPVGKNQLLPVRLSSFREVKEFFDSQQGGLKRLREEFGEDRSMDTSLSPTRLIDQEFLPLVWGPFYKQLYIYDYLKMHARAFELKNHNALASSAVKILSRFTLGRGVSFTIKHPGARKVWEEFWERNQMKKKLRQMASDLTWQGELLLRYYDVSHGRLTLKVVDPSSCWEIVTDPEDIDKVYYYHFQWPTPYQMWVSGQIPVSKYVVQQIPPTNIQHIKMNVSAQEKRGRSDLLPAMPWLKRFNDYYSGVTLKAVLEANLVWKVTVQGDQADVDAILSDPKLTEMPPPGGTWVQNPSVNLEPVSAQMTAAGRVAGGIGGQIASIVACSLNLPNEYFNVEGAAGGARATALVRTDPAVKTIEDRQQMFRECIEEIYLRVMENALAAGRIPPEAAREEPDRVDEFDDGDEEEEELDVSQMERSVS